MKNRPIRYFAVGYGNSVEIRASRTPPKGIASKIKSGRKILLKQTVWLGGTVLGVCSELDFLRALQADHGACKYSPGMGEAVEITRDLRLRALRRSR